eukprot:PhF_6_TR32993/c0_g1_i1/m.48601
MGCKSSRSDTFRSPSQMVGTDQYNTSVVRVTPSLKMTKDPDSGCNLMNQYMHIRALGRGAQGMVWLVLDTTTERMYAAKYVNRALITKNELSILRSIRHPHIVTLFEVVDDMEADHVVLILEYMSKGAVVHLAGGENKTVEGPLDSTIVRQVAVQVLQALAYLHSRGIVHNDIKPDNILGTQGEEWGARTTQQSVLVKICDFGGSMLNEASPLSN